MASHLRENAWGDASSWTVYSENTLQSYTHTPEEADSCSIAVWGHRKLVFLTTQQAWNKQLFFPSEYWIT